MKNPGIKKDKIIKSVINLAGIFKKIHEFIPEKKKSFLIYFFKFS